MTRAHEDRDLILLLREAQALLTRTGNRFGWSGWDGPEEALREIDTLVGRIESGDGASREDVAVLFAPTGSLQEVAVSSGWGAELLDLAGRVEATLERARQGTTPRPMLARSPDRLS